MTQSRTGKSFSVHPEEYVEYFSKYEEAVNTHKRVLLLLVVWGHINHIYE